MRVWFAMGLVWSITAFSIFLSTTVALAADDDAPSDAKPIPAVSDVGKAVPSAEAKAAAAQFNQVFDEFRKILVELRETQGRYQLAAQAERPAVARQYDALVEQGREVLAKLLPAAKAAWLAAPNTDRGVAEFLASHAVDLSNHDDYEPAFELSKILIDGGFAHDEFWNYAGIDAFSTNHFDLAKEWLEKAKAAKKLSKEVGTNDLAAVPELQKDWPEEEKIREAEAKADDLPRVRLTTSQGDIVVELFENEAPNTTANFIDLVEKHFYDTVPFHRVISGFMAQGGDPSGTGRGSPGYTIACECYQENARKHFAGSLSMANAGKDTGGSQFFLTFAPTPFLNGKHTVFGRVIEGMDVLSRLQRIDPDDKKAPSKLTPDRIIKAVVERKRDHEYVPETTPLQK